MIHGENMYQCGRGFICTVKSHSFDLLTIEVGSKQKVKTPFSLLLLK